MKKLLAISLLTVTLSLFQGITLFAQFTPEEQHQLDSLNAIIANPNSHDTSLARAYVELSSLFYISNVDTLKILCEKTIAISKEGLSHQPTVASKKSLLISLGDAFNNIGAYYNLKGDMVQALNYFQRSLFVQEKLDDKAGIAYRLNNIAYIYNNQGDITQSLEYYHRSLKTQEELGDKKGIAICLNNIAGIYHEQEEIALSLEYYYRSLKIREEIGNKRMVATVLNNIGCVYDGEADVDKALDYFQKSLKIRKEIGYKKGIAVCFNNIGGVYKSQGDIPKALNYYHRSLEIKRELQDKQGIAKTLNNIGGLELKMGDLLNTRKKLEEALRIGKEIGSPARIATSANFLSQLENQKKNYKEAFKMYKLYITMRDSTENEALQKAIMRQEARYEFEKQKTLDDAAHENQKAMNDAEHEKILAVEHEEKKKQEILTIAVGLGLFLVVVFLLFVFNRLRITRKQKEVIEHQKEEVEIAHKATEKQKEQVEEAHKEITDSINYAERIQRSFLATKELLDENLQEYFVFFKPKDVVSGDFYWASKLNNSTFSMVNADSTGHGVPGAIMSILNISSIEKSIDKGFTQPADIFNDTRKTIIERLKKDGSKDGGKDGMDASIVCFDFNTLKMTYCAAQNPIWIVRNGEVIQIKPEKMPIGKHDKDNVPFVGGELQLQKGDQVYTLTDGFQDQFGGEKGKKFMVKKMREYVLSISHLAMQEQLVQIDKVFTDWKGDLEQIDDVCVIGMKV